MKLLCIIFIGAFALTVARPSYIIDFEIDDVNQEQEHEQEGIAGSAVEGEYSWTAPNGEELFIKYIADHMGYRVVESNTLPKSPEADLEVSSVAERKEEKADEEGDGDISLSITFEDISTTDDKDDALGSEEVTPSVYNSEGEQSDETASNELEMSIKSVSSDEEAPENEVSTYTFYTSEGEQSDEIASNELEISIKSLSSDEEAPENEESTYTFYTSEGEQSDENTSDELMSIKASFLVDHDTPEIQQHSYTYYTSEGETSDANKSDEFDITARASSVEDDNDDEPENRVLFPPTIDFYKPNTFRLQNQDSDEDIL